MLKNIDFHTVMDTALVIAHRGSRGHAPENTLSAAELAYSAGADLWELDVNYTKDGQLVVIHDDTVERTTNALTVFPNRSSYRVCDFTFAELMQLDAGSWYGQKDPFGRIAASEISPACLTNFKGLKIPTLREALLLTQQNDWFVNVEIKDHKSLRGHDTITRDVLALIEELKMVDRVLISSFQHQYLRECRALCPKIATGALVEHTRPENAVRLCKDLDVQAYHPDRLILAPGDLADLRNAGLAINVWTVNDPNEAKNLVAQGATGIITDFPALMLMTLDRQ